MTATSPKKASFVPPLYQAVLSLVYLLGRLWYILGQTPQVCVDLQDYIYNASTALGLDFFCFSKPAGVALIYKLLGSSYERIIIFQAMLSAACWLVLTFVVISRLRSRWMKIAAFPLLLLFSLNADGLAWDAVILSESISLSIMILFMSLSLLLLTSSNHMVPFLVVLTGGGWALVKESNAILILLCALLLLVSGVLLRSGRRFLLTGILLAMVFLTSLGFSSLGERWKFPLLNLLGQRVLAEPAMLSYFEGAGMPVNDALLELQGAWGSSGGNVFLNSHDLRPFQAWFHASGKKVYVRYLLSHPGSLAIDPLRHLKTMLSSEMLGTRCLHPLWHPVFFVLFPLVWHPVFIILYTLAVAASVPLLLRLNARGLGLWILVNLMLVYPHLVLVWHGDAMEIARHAMQIRIQFYLGILLAGLFLANTRRADRAASLKTLNEHFSTFDIMLARCLIASGLLLAFFSLWCDLVLAPGYFEYSFQFGLRQAAGLLLGLLLAGVGFAVAAREKTDYLISRPMIKSLLEPFYQRKAMTTRITTLIDLQLAAYNRCDLDGFVACYAPDALLFNLPDHTLVASSHAEMRERYRQRFENPNLQVEITNRMMLGDYLIDFENITGLPDTDLLEAIVIYQVKNDLISRVWFIRKE